MNGRNPNAKKVFLTESEIELIFRLIEQARDQVMDNHPIDPETEEPSAAALDAVAELTDLESNLSYQTR